MSARFAPHRYSAPLRLYPILLIAAVGLLLFFVSVAGASAAVISGTVTGRLPGHTPEGIAEVAVEVSDSATGKEVGTTFTDSGGKYSFELGAGVFDVKFSPGPESPFGSTTIHKLEVSGSRSLSVELRRAGMFELSGVIRDAAGNPVPNATIGLSGEFAGYDTTTAADGSYSFEAQPGQYTISASSKGAPIAGLPDAWSVGTQGFALEADRKLDLTLPPTTTLTVEVLGSKGEPVSEASVSLPGFNHAADLGGVEGYAGVYGMGGNTGEDGRVTFTTFDGGTIEGPGFISPPTGSPYGYTQFKVPPIAGPTTVVVHFTGEEEEAEDHEAPKIDELLVEPDSFDTSEGERTVVAYAHITDDLSGLKEARIRYVSPSGEVSYQGSTSEPLEGSATNGLYKIPIAFPQFSEGGTWTIASIWLGDHAGHQRELGPEQLEELGLQRKILVKGEADNEPPQLHSLEIEPTEIDTSAAKQPVFVTAKISDNLSGFKEGFIAFASPSGEQFAVGGEFKLLSGNEIEGLYRVLVTFPQGSEAGAWNISSVTLVDQAGNKAAIPRKEIEEAGMPHTVIVSAAAPTVTAIEPSSGPEAGGTEVLISGSHLGGTEKVRFGSTAATEFAVKSPNLVWAISPPGTGTVDVTVTTAGGISETSAADRFTYAPQVTLSSTPNPSVHGQKVTFTAKVIPAGGPTPIGTVAFTEGSNVLGVVNLSKGTATFNTTALSAGKHPIYASYSGDANYPAAQSALITQSVEKASTQLLLASSLSPAPYGSSATLKATVNALAPGAGTPAGTVTFREGETVIDTVQLNGHTASLSLKTMAPGKHPISASYSGDPNNQASSGEAFAQTIVKASTELELTSSLNPAPYGSSATLKATVDSLAPSVLTPTGTVTFREGETVLAIVPLSAGGVAKYALKTVAPGSYEITATYSGAEGFGASESTLTQSVVKAGTELTLTSGKNPAPKGSSGTLKASLKTLAPGGGTATGTVTFREGETVLATIPLSGASVTYPLKSLAIGTHNITATYSGSANYLGSEGAISQVITP